MGGVASSRFDFSSLDSDVQGSVATTKDLGLFIFPIRWLLEYTSGDFSFPGDVF